MVDNIILTVLIENNASQQEGLCHEHGLSIYIEVDGLRLLFDTGQTGKFLDNVKKLNVNLQNADYILISHGHYDHSGGLMKFLEVNDKENVNLIVGKGFFKKKYKYLGENQYKFIGNPFNSNDLIKRNVNITEVEENTYEIVKGINIYKGFDQWNEYELLNNQFVLLNKDKEVVDRFSDEIVLGIDTDKGLLVIVGCCHIGIVNILESIKRRTGKRIYGVVGGTHLVSADEERINKTIAYFKENRIELVAVSHCTGDKAMKAMEEAFEDSFVCNDTGYVIEVKR